MFVVIFMERFRFSALSAGTELPAFGETIEKPAADITSMADARLPKNAGSGTAGERIDVADKSWEGPRASLGPVQVR